MLLSSPISCEMHLPSTNTIISRMRSPPPTSCPSPTAILSSCRALQSLIQSSLPSNTQTSAPSRLDSPIRLTSPGHAPLRKKKPHTVKKATPRTSQRKRPRALSDDMGPLCDQENVTSTTTSTNTNRISKPSTPKRQRRCPPTLPLGLEQDDFEALSPSSSSSSTPPQQPFQLQPDTTFVTPSQPLPFDLPLLPVRHRSQKDSEGDTAMHQVQVQGDNTDDAWTAQDDAALISLILNKLRLRQSDWDEAARRLGKGMGKGGRDSMGERWRLLAGEGGDVGKGKGKGLRRSTGGLKRRGLDTMMEFGPEIQRRGGLELSWVELS